MNVNEMSRAEALGEAIENARRAARRERALLRSPVKQPTGPASADTRKVCQEMQEELKLRGR